MNFRSFLESKVAFGPHKGKELSQLPREELLSLRAKAPPALAQEIDQILGGNDPWKAAREAGLRVLGGSEEKRFGRDVFERVRRELSAAARRPAEFFEAVPPLGTLPGWLLFYTPRFERAIMELWTRSRTTKVVEAVRKTEEMMKGEEDIEDRVFAFNGPSGEFDKLIDEWVASKKFWNRKDESSVEMVVRRMRQLLADAERLERNDAAGA